MIKGFTNILLVWRTDTAEIFSFSIRRCYEAGWKPGHSYAASAVHNQHTSSPKRTSCYHAEPQQLLLPLQGNTGLAVLQGVCRHHHDIILFWFLHKNINTMPEMA